MVAKRDELIEKIIKYANDDYTKDQYPFVEDCVDSAISEVCNHMCPWGVNDEQAYKSLKAKALIKYPWVIYRVAQFHYDKQGKEGVTTFYESGQTQSYGTGGTPDSFFETIIPIAKIV